jgi:hypothetical protein
MPTAGHLFPDSTASWPDLARDGRAIPHGTPDRYAQGLVAIGAVLRISQYVFNRSLWLDEASLADNIVARSYGQLMQPLYAAQAAPPGFLIVEKAVAQVLGTGEYALRLLPLAAGLLSLWLFARVARRILAPAASLIAIALFATLDPLVYFSSELKQYSSDVLVAVLLLWTTTIAERRRFDASALVLSAGVGAAAIWFSHPAVFVLAAIESVWIVTRLRRRQWRAALQIAGLGAVWAASFALCYVLVLSPLVANPELQSFWAHKFVFEGAGTPILETLIDTKLVLALPVLAGFLLLRSRDDRLALLLLPACVAFAAAVLHRYPFTGRLLLFLIPSALLLFARATAALAACGNPRMRALGRVVTVAVIAPFLATSVYRLFVPRVREETRAELAWMSRQARPGDLCYVYYATETSMIYYAPRFGLPTTCLMGVSSRSDRSRYVADLERIPKGRRVWVVFSHVYHDDQPEDERLFFLSQLDWMGRRLQAHEGTGAFVYLYDLTP